MNRFTKLGLFLLFILLSIFPVGFLFSEENQKTTGITSESIDEASLPILGGSTKNTLTQDMQNISLFSIADFIKLILFLLFFLFCMLGFKKFVMSYKEVKGSKSSGFVKELASYDIDSKNSVRIISILGTVYVFLVSGNSSILLKEINNEEEVLRLEFELSKESSIANSESFKSILKKMMGKGKDSLREEDNKNDYKELEKDIESSFKDKQERLKKF